MTPQRINQIGSTIANTARLLVWLGGAYVAYNGHWVSAIILFLIGLALHWKHDGKWADDGATKQQ